MGFAGENARRVIRHRNVPDGISCADKLHNARAILADYRQVGEAVWQRFRTKSRADQVWYYGELVKIFKNSNPSRLAGDLEETVNKWK